MARTETRTQSSITPFTQSAFVTGRWSGGRGTIEDAYIQYRDVKSDKPFTVVEAHLVIVDEQEQKHDIPYQINFKNPVIIRATADEDADEAERGYAISGGGVRADQDWAALLQSAWTNGFPESKVSDGDIRGIIGVDAEWVEKPHKGVKDDKYPMLLITEIYGGVKGASAKKSKRADEEEEERPKRKRAAADEEEERPVRGKGTSGSSRSATSPKKHAIQFVLDALEDGKGETTSGDVMRQASKFFRTDEGKEVESDDRKAILELLGDDDFYLDQGDKWTYKKRTGEIVAKD